MATEENISDLMRVIDTPPEEAAENIKGARDLDIHPDEFASARDEFTQAQEIAAAPDNVSSSVAKHALRSKQSAALMKKGLADLDAYERQWRFSSDQVEGANIRRKMNKLSAVRARGFQLTEEEEHEMQGHHRDTSKLTDAEDFDYNMAEALPGQLAGVGVDLAQAVWEGRDLTAIAGVAGLGFGMGVGFLAGGPAGAIALGKAGLISGATLATTFGSIPLDTYEQSLGGIYRELGNSELMKKGGVSYIPIFVIAKKIPFLKKIVSPKAFVKQMVNGANRKWLDLSIDIAASGIVEGLEEGSQELIQIISQSIGDTWDGTDTSYYNGMKNALAKYETWKQAGKSAFVGSVAGGLFAGTGITVSKGIDSTSGVLRDKLGDNRFLAPFVGTNPPPQRENVGDGFNPNTDMVGETSRMSPEAKGEKALSFSDGLKRASNSTKDLEMNELVPGEMNQLRDDVFNDGGIHSGYVDKDDLFQWVAGDPDKAQLITALSDTETSEEAGINAPFRINLSKALKIIDAYEDFADIVRSDPDVPSAKEYLNELKTQIENAPVGDIEQNVKSQLDEDDVVLYQGVRAGNVDGKDGKSGFFTTSKEKALDHANKEGPGGKVRITSAKNMPEGTFANELGESISIEDFLKTTNVVGTNLTEDVKILGEIPGNKPSLEEVRRFKEERRVELVGQQNYLEQPMSEKLAAARQSVVKALKKSEDMSKVSSMDAEQQAIVDEERRRSVVESDKNIKVVEDFLSNKMGINLESVSEELTGRYAGNATLKKRNVFTKDGADINELVVEHGVENAAELLEILSTTPTIDEAVELNIKAEQADNKSRKNNIKEVTKSELVKKYNILTEQYIGEIKKLALKLPKNLEYKIPKFDKLYRVARNKIKDTRVKYLNPNQWKVGERKSYRKAMEAANSGDILQALTHLEEAALNTQLAKETHAKIAMVNNSFEFIARVNGENLRNQLRKTNAVYEKSINSLLEFFNFASNSDIGGDINDYNKLIDKMVGEGKGDFRLSEEVQEWLTPTERISDLSVSQITKITNLIRKILHESNTENELIGKYITRDADTIELTAEVLRESALSNPSYDRSKIVSNQGVESRTRKFVNFITHPGAALTNLQFQMQKSDNGVLNGVWAQNIYQRMMGLGKHRGETGQRAKVAMQGRFKKRFQEHVKKYGRLAFNNLGVMVLNIPEFARIDSLSNGKVTKADLLVMLMNMGNAENIQATTNFKGLTPEVLWTVLQRELGQKEFDFVQDAVWDMFEELKPLVDKLELRTKNNQLDFVQAESFEAFGKTYRGGYMPIKYKIDSDMEGLIEEQRLAVEMQDWDKLTPVFPSLVYRGMVSSDFTKERTGAPYEIDLDITTVAFSLEEVIHDITMREPVRDTMALMRNKSISDDLKAMHGFQGYNAMTSSIAEQTNSIGVRNMKLFGGLQKYTSGLLSKFESGFAVNHILFNPSSVIMSAMAIPEIINKMGIANSGQYLGMAVLNLLTPFNGGKTKALYDLAREIDPSIDGVHLGLDEMNMQSITENLPKKRLFHSKAYNLAKTAQERSISLGFTKSLGAIDMALKTATVTAAYNQYKNGDAKGHPIEKIQAMTEEELHSNAMAYAEQMSASTTMRADKLSRAGIQKIPGGSLIAKFWNESRTALLNRFQGMRNFRANAKETLKKHKEGDIAGANLEMYGMAGDATTFLVMSMLGLAIMNYARGTYQDEEADLPDGFTDIPNWMFEKLTTFDGLTDLASAGIFGHMLFLRDMMFSAKIGKGITFPVQAGFNDATTTALTVPYVIEARRNEATFIEITEGMSRKETRAFFNMIGYASGGIPVSAGFKLYDWINSDDDDLLNKPNGATEKSHTLDILGSFVAKYLQEDLTPEQEHELQGEARDQRKKDSLQQAVEQSQEVINKLLGADAPDPLTDVEYEIIKHAESGGKWNNINPKSSAGGLYQFTKGTWEDIRLSAEGKKAGLTKSGRLDQRPQQQEAAMEIYVGWNAKKLRENKVDVNIDTIYFAHHFGTNSIKHAKVIFESPDKTPIPKGLLSGKIKSQNPDLKDVKTVGEFKHFLNTQLRRGRKGALKKP
jgi:hypothetical protein